MTPGEIHIAVPIDGYRFCGCGTQVPEHTWAATGRRCMTCFTDGTMVELHEIEIRHRGHRTQAKLPTSKWAPRPNSRARGPQHKKALRASAKALKRLKMLFPEAYDVLYAEERHKQGLPPVAHPDPGHLERAVATYLRARAYALDDTEGAEDDDAPQDARADP